MTSLLDDPTADPLRVAFQAAPIGLGVFDADLRFVEVNDALAAMNGIPAAEHLGVHGPDLLPDVDPAVWTALRRVIETGTPEPDVLVVGRTPAAEDARVWLEQLLPWRDARGQVCGAVTAVLEITEQRRAEETARRRGQRLDSLASLASGLLSPGAPERAAAALAQHAMQLVGADGALVAMEDAGGLRAIASVGDSRALEGRLATAAPGTIAAPEGRITALPLHRGRKAIGAILLALPDGHSLDPEDRATLKTMASIGGQAIHRARMEVDRTRRQAHAGFLAEIAHLFTTLATPDEIMEAVGARIGEYLGVSSCLFCDVDEPTETITADYGWNAAGAPSLRRTYRIQDYLTPEFARASRAGEIVVVRDTQHDPRTDSDAYAALDVRAFVTVPFHNDGEWRAYIGVTEPHSREWRSDELDLIREVANQIFPRLERARAEQALRTSEARYRALFETMDEGFCIVEVLFDAHDRPFDYQFLEVNPAFERHTGVENALGKLASVVAPGLEHFWYDTYGAVALTGTPTRFVSHSVPVGRWFDVYAFRVGEPHERRIAILFNDVTRRAEAEAERDAQFERERRGREAAQAFLAVMSHELRTPVTSIYGTASLLSRNPQRRDAGDLLADISDEAERLTRIIDDLMVLSGVERGLLELAPEPILLRHAIDEVVADVARRFPDVEFAGDLGHAIPAVTADATALRQVLHNLLVNAAKYAGQDGPVTVRVRESGDLVEVEVLDEGPGLGPEPAALFGLFYRAPHTAKHASGTGIGLYVAQELLAAMGSRIAATTREPRGASFRFSLPKALDE